MQADQIFLISQIGHEASLWLLLLLSVFSVGIALERFFFIRGWVKSSGKLFKEVEEAVNSGQLNWIKNTKFQNKDKDPGSHLAALYMKKNPDLISQAMASFSASKKIQLESRLSFLATVGSNAPFIGLLGTIFGVMDAFNALGISQDQIAAPIVMIGISKALLAAAVGLLVAIPAVIFYNYLRRQVRVVLQNLEGIAGGYALYSTFMKNSPSDKKSASEKVLETSFEN